MGALECPGQYFLGWWDLKHTRLCLDYSRVPSGSETVLGNHEIQEMSWDWAWVVEWGNHGNHALVTEWGNHEILGTMSGFFGAIAVASHHCKLEDWTAPWH